MNACPADVPDTSRGTSFTQRARDRAQQAAHDAASCIAEGRFSDARTLLQEAAHHLDRMEEWQGAAS